MNEISSEITNEYLEYIKEHFEENRASALSVKDYLEHSSVAYHGRCVHTLHIPKVFPKAVTEEFRKIVSTTYRIFTKVIENYIKNPAYRRQFPFSKELEELILVPNLYDSLLPIARFDIFFNEEDFSFKYCEINTDGTSAMNEDYVLNQAITLNIANEYMRQRYSYHVMELFDSWVREFMNIYATYKKRVSKPYVAIVDFMEHTSITEFEEFQRRFEKAGYACELCEITELTYREHALYSPKGRKIDVVYRRAVTSDIMEAYDKVQPFIEAVKNQDVCIIGSFCTQIIHNKWLFKVIREKATYDFLTDEEIAFVEEHIPYTNLLDKETAPLVEVLSAKDKWIIKPLDSYASKGVFAGIDYSLSEWQEIVERHEGQGYIYQEYYPPYRTKNIYFPDSDASFKEYTNMSGLFVYNGQFAGVYSRLSDGGIISSQYNEKAVASLFVDE